MSFFKFTDEELASMKGKFSDPDIDVEADKAIKRLATNKELGLPKEMSDFIAGIVDVCNKQGRLRVRHESARTCPICKRDAGYAKYTRTSRTHRKGENNYSQELSMYCIELNSGFIHFRNRLNNGCCLECWKKVQPILGKYLDEHNVKAAIPKEVTGHDPKYAWFQNRKCNQCGWTGHEGEMGDCPAMMGGYYKGQCPKCGTKNLAFGPTQVEIADGFTLVEIKT